MTVSPSWGAFRRMTGLTPGGASAGSRSRQPPVVAGRAALGDGALAHLAEFVGSGVAVVGAALGQHFARYFGVAGLTGGLETRGGWSGERPSQARPSRIAAVKASVLRSAVGVLDADEVFAAVVAGEQEVEQGGACAADVQQASGARGETGSDGHTAGFTMPGADAKGFGCRHLAKL